MFQDGLPRRSFLDLACRFGLIGLAGPAVLAGCGGEDHGTGGTGSGGQTGTAGARTGAATPADPCDDLSGLTEAEIAVRHNLGYVAHSTDPAKSCHICHFWQPPATGTCGTCQLFKGPVHPDGVCNSWVAKAETSG